MSTIKSTKLLTKGKVSLKKTKEGLLVTSPKGAKNSGIYYVFNVQENTSYVVTLAGKKMSADTVVCLVVWSGKKTPISCKKVFTTTSNTYGHVIPHRKGRQLCIGVLFRNPSSSESFMLNNLVLMSRTRRQSIKYNTLKPPKVAKVAKPVKKPASRRPSVVTVTPPKPTPIDFEKLREIASRERSASIVSTISAEEKDAISELTQQLEKLSKLKSDMEENFSKMFEDQRTRIKRLEQEKKNMKKQLSSNEANTGSPNLLKIPVQHVNGESDSEDYYGSMSASMEMFPSLEMSDSMDSVPPMEFQAIPIESPSNNKKS